MALEVATLIHQLDAANPAGPDRLANGDDHLRMIKLCIKNTFPNINAAVNASDEDLNTLSGLGVPVGLISLWYGTAALCPAGYAICDGTLGTPDMRGRVPVGLSGVQTVGQLFGQDSKTVTSATGGAHSHIGVTDLSGSHGHTGTVDSHVLTIDEIPSHDHDLKAYPRLDTDGAGGVIGSGDETVSMGQAGTDGFINSTGGGLGHTHAATGLTGGNHAHAVAVDAVPAHTHGVTVDVVQASIALHYIMKV